MTQQSWPDIIRDEQAKRDLLRRIVRDSPDMVEYELRLHYAELKAQFAAKKKARRAERKGNTK